MISKLAVLFVVAPVLWGQSYTVSTFAGGGLPVTPAPALSASIGDVSGLALDSGGNLYISDPYLDVVFKVSPAGTATIFAGIGKQGYAGDGGLATGAELYVPRGLAFDASGNLLIADAGNAVIRAVSPSGTITTRAGNGTRGYSGDGGPATAATLNDPRCVTVDSSGNLYIADTQNSVIRFVSSSGTISTFAGNGTAGYSGDGGPATGAMLNFPDGVAVDASGNLYIADAYNLVVREISTGGTITTFAGNGLYGNSGDGGPATAAELTSPNSVAVDAGGNLYIADSNDSVIREVSRGTISTFAGNGTGYSGDGGLATSAELNYPTVVSCGANGIVAIGDSDNYRVREISSSGIITTVAGNGSYNYAGDNGAAASALFGGPQGVGYGPDGSIYIADSDNNRMRKVSPAGVITTIAGNGFAGYSGDGGPATAAELNHPFGVAVDGNSNVFVADFENRVVRKISSSGIVNTVAGTGDYGYSGDGGPATNAMMGFPTGVAVDNSGNLYIADESHNVIRKVTTGGIITTVAGSGTSGYSGDGGFATSATLDNPQGVAVDGFGNLLIADTLNNVIREVNTSGIITTMPATIGSLSGPYGVAVDAGNNLYITDTYRDDIKKVSPLGVLSIIANISSTYGYSGDGGPALYAELNAPEGIAAGANGVLYIADTDNNAIRTLTPCIQSLTSSANADSSAQTLNMPLTAASSCSWSATSLPSWITAASSGTGSGTLALALQSNTSGADRVATIAVNGLPVNVFQAFTASTFTDVVPGQYYFDAVNLLRGESITAGCGNNDYCPGSVVTRDDMAIFIVRTILGSGTFTYSPTSYFADVPTTYFAFPWIQKLYELGITAGCGGTPINYCPGATVTRDQMAIFIVRARYGAATMFTWNPAPYFADVPLTYYAFDWIQRMYQDNITAGCGGAPLNYCPGSAVTRGDMAIFLMRAGYNQLLPSNEPVITSLSPNVLSHGTSGTFIITGANTTFQQGATNLVFAANSGITVNSLTVTSATTMQVSLTASSATPQQAVSIYEQTEPQEAVLPNGLLIQ